MDKKNKNQPQEYLDTYAIECSRLQATEKTDDDKSKWRNTLGNGIKVNPGDSIEVSSAFLNANGAGDGVSSISFDGQRLGTYTETGLWTDATYSFTGTHSNEVFDNKTQMKINFYKNNDALCCLRLPCTTFNKVYEDNPATVANFDTHNATNRHVPIQTSDNNTGTFTKDNILNIYKKNFDCKRFTIYERDKGKDNKNLIDFDNNEPGYYMWYEYEKFIEIETDKGFNNVNNVAQDITIQLNKIINEYSLTRRPKEQLTNTNFNLEVASNDLPISSVPYIKDTSMIKETQCFKAFNCGTRYTLCENAFTAFYNLSFHSDVYLRNFDFVATKYANFRNAGLKLGNRWHNNTGPNIPYIKESIANAVTNTWVEVSEHFWNEKENYFKWFDTQQREEDLLEKLNYTASERFLHISVTDGYSQRIGSDLKFMELSHVCTCHFNLNYYGIETEASKEAPWKGWIAREGNTGSYQYYLKLSTPTSIKYPLTSNNRSIGYDRAFSAYGNDSLLLFNGLSQRQDPNATIPVTPTDPAPLNAILRSGKYYYTDIIIDKVYLGCFPKLEYNSVENKFEFSNLHTGRPAGNTPYSLTPISAYSVNANLNPNAGNNYYLINPFNHPIIYHPHVRPTTATPQTALLQEYNVLRWTVFDSFSGIGIKSFGIDDNNHYRNFLYVLGYKNIIPDLNVDKYTTLIRNNFDIVSYPFTTNAQLESPDIIQYNGNLFGAAYFTNQPPVLQQIVSHNWTVGFNQIIINATSTTFTADKIASKTNHGFYIIRSDMIGESKYISNGELVNTVSIVSKENRIDDFLFMQGTGDMIYTFKQPCTIQNIKTEIYNNDNTPAILDDNNSVIYKIKKKNIETIMID
tara:strand:- start:604 stop:3180 length:2577 start_codon:yes stop_codon:yes gene_type:complete